jgi:hypothetical protein
MPRTGVAIDLCEPADQGLRQGWARGSNVAKSTDAQVNSQADMQRLCRMWTPTVARLNRPVTIMTLEAHTCGALPKYPIDSGERVGANAATSS